MTKKAYTYAEVMGILDDFFDTYVISGVRSEVDSENNVFPAVTRHDSKGAPAACYGLSKMYTHFLKKEAKRISKGCESE
jgi:hypothetical protein